MKVMFTITLLAGLYFLASRLVAQGDSLKPRKNIIEVFNSRNNSLNGIYPNITPNYFSIQLLGGWGMAYTRYLGKQGVGLEGSFHQWWVANTTHYSTGSGPKGTFVHSWSSYFSTRIQCPLAHGQRIKWYGSGGLTFRSGYETIVIRPTSLAGGWTHQLWEGELQRDLGISTGTRLSYNPFWRIVMALDLRYTYFVYR